MNYKDDILENKAFNLFKQLMYNLALAICIMLVGVLVCTYAFKYELYVVQTGSEEPFLPVGCLVVVQEQENYEVWDIITFYLTDTFLATHRLIAKHEEGGKTYYICHGDNVQNADGSACIESGYEDDVKYIQSLYEANPNLTIEEIRDLAGEIQTPTIDKVKGKVVNHINNYGSYVQYIQSHYMLLIAIVAGIWCVSGFVQTEIDIKRSRRLF